MRWYHILRGGDSNTGPVAVVKQKGVHRHPPRVHRLSTEPCTGAGALNIRVIMSVPVPVGRSS